MMEDFIFLSRPVLMTCFGGAGLEGLSGSGVGTAVFSRFCVIWKLIFLIFHLKLSFIQNFYLLKISFL